MWAGMSPEVFWRKIGFAELDSGCKQTSYDTSFANGGAPLLDPRFFDHPYFVHRAHAMRCTVAPPASRACKPRT